MTTPLNFARDMNGYNAFAPQPSSQIYSVTLTSGSNATLTLPANASPWVANFSLAPGSVCWVAYQGNSASAPAGGSFASTTSELNPGQRLVPATYISSGVVTANTINVLNSSASTTVVSISLYSSPT